MTLFGKIAFSYLIKESSVHSGFGGSRVGETKSNESVIIKGKTQRQKGEGHVNMEEETGII